MNLTSLLVLTTLFISVFNGLPKTSYVKLVDVWLIFHLIVPFCEVIVHTAADVLRNPTIDESEEEKRAKAKEKKEVEANNLLEVI